MSLFSGGPSLITPLSLRDAQDDTGVVSWFFLSCSWDYESRKKSKNAPRVILNSGPSSAGRVVKDLLHAIPFNLLEDKQYYVSIPFEEFQRFLQWCHDITPPCAIYNTHCCAKFEWKCVEIHKIISMFPTLVRMTRKKWYNNHPSPPAPGSAGSGRRRA